MVSKPDSRVRPLFQDAAAASVAPVCPPLASNPAEAAPRPAEPEGSPPARQVRPLELPPAQPPPQAKARIAPLRLPERAAFSSPLPVSTPAPVQALLLPERALPAAAEPAYAPASLLFDEGRGSDLERLKRQAIEALPAISARQLDALDQAIRELLPVEVANLAAWGNPLLRRVEAMTIELQRLTAVVVSWNAGELIERCNRAMGAAGLWKIFQRNSPGSLKPALELILAQAAPTLDALDVLAGRFVPCCDDLFASLLLFKIAPQVLALRDIEAEALSRRGHLLTLSAQHFDLLEPQLEQLRRQVITWQSEIEQLVRVTIPVWELAHGKASG